VIKKHNVSPFGCKWRPVINASAINAHKLYRLGQSLIIIEPMNHYWAFMGYHWAWWSTGYSQITFK